MKASPHTRHLFKFFFLPWIVFAIGALFYCYEYLLRILPSVMTSELMSTFGMSAGILGNLIAYYYYIYTPMQLPVGILMDRYSPRFLLIFACLSCAIGAFWFTHTQHTEVIGFSRLLMGFGSAFAFVGILKIASLWFPENHFALASGLALFLGMIGAITSTSIMAGLVGHIGWRNAMLYASYMGIIIAIIMVLGLRDRPQWKTPDLILPERATFKKLGPEIFVLMKNPVIWLNGLVGGLMYLPTSAFAELWGVPFLETTYRMTGAAAARAVSLVFLGIAIGALLTGWVSDKLRRRRSPLIAGGLLAGFFSIILIFIPHLPAVILYIALFLLGLTSSVQILVFPISREISPNELAGTAIAFTNTLVMTSGVISQPLIGYFLDLKWNGLRIHNIPVYTPENYTFALLIIPASMFFGVFLMCFIPETHAKLECERTVGPY